MSSDEDHRLTLEGKAESGIGFMVRERARVRWRVRRAHDGFCHHTLPLQLVCVRLARALPARLTHPVITSSVCVRARLRSHIRLA
jgi:hypothetical protein